MHIVRTTSLMDCAKPLAARLNAELGAGKQVLWLVTGGSNVHLAAAVMDLIPIEASARLDILLTDERYGKPGHKDSNMTQLDVAGFKPLEASVHPVLQDGLSPQDTARRYGELYDHLLGAADIAIALFGMGADGHIAGILPDSDAATATGSAYYYQGPDFQRLTLTFPALQRLTAAYACVFGATKKPALQSLASESLTVSQQPAQILKQIPDSYVYNDQICKE